MEEAIAALIAEIGIEGMDAFELDLGTAGKAAENAGNAIQAGLSNLVVGVEAMLAVGAGAFTAFTALSIQEAVKIDRYRSTIAGIYDSIEEGEKRIAYIRQYARSSMNTSDTLLELGTRAEAGGLNFGPVMKMVDVLSRGNAQNAALLTDALVRAGSGGNFGVVMRALQRFGIGYNDIIAQGIKVSGGHHIEATGEAFIDALLAIFRRKMPVLGEYLKNSVATRLVDLQDSWNQMTEAFGRAWFPAIDRVLRMITPFINFLTDTGEVKRLGEAFSSAFAGLFGAANGDRAVIVFLTYVITALEMLPGVIRNIGMMAIGVGKAIANAIIGGLNAVMPGVLMIYNRLHNTVSAMGQIFEYIWVSRIKPILDMWQWFQNSIHQVAKLLGPLANTLPGMRILHLIAPNLPNFAKAFAGPGPEWKPLANVDDALNRGIKGLGLSDFDKSQKDMLARFDQYLKSPQSNLDDPSGGKLFNRMHQEGVDAEKQTAQHTASMAASMDHFKTYILGGGDRGKAGISAAEMYGHPAGGRMEIDVRSGNVHLDRFLSEVIGKYHSGARRHDILGRN